MISVAAVEFPLSFSRRFLKDHKRSAAHYKNTPDDFIVDENLGFLPSGEGEHFYIQIRKTGQNTHWVKKEISRQLSIKTLDIGHAGLKDRHAITTQWLSLYLPGSDPELDKLDIPGLQILQTGRHLKKLRPGVHQGNHFQLCLRGLQQSEVVINLLQLIKQEGFANYFGEQRFGMNGANLRQGWALLRDRRLKQNRKKSLYLSALRSFLFNQVLSARLDQSTEKSFDNTGPLWGRGLPMTEQYQAEFEKNVLKPWQQLCEALEYSGLNQERRPLYASPREFDYQWQDDKTLQLKFELPPGVYATALLSEVADLKDASALGQ